MADRNTNATEHAWVEERLSAYIDNQLAPLERVQLERHLRDCARCQASLASLRWTVSLVKQAPAPVLPHQFTLPVPAPTRRAPAYGFGFARLATVVVTLLLFAVVGVDVISQFGGRYAASAPALQYANPTSIALAPTMNQAEKAAPTAAPAPTSAPAPTTAPPATSVRQPGALPPAPAAAPSPAPTEALGRGGAPAETNETDGTAKGATGTPTAPKAQAPVRAPAASATITTSLAVGAANVATAVPPTATSVPPTATPPPTATATVVLPTATRSLPSPTPAAQALVQPTVAPLPPARDQAETYRPVVTPLRVAEIGLFFFAVFFGTLAVLLRRGK